MSDDDDKKYTYQDTRPYTVPMGQFGDTPRLGENSLPNVNLGPRDPPPSLNPDEGGSWRAYDQPGMQERMNQGVKEQSNLMGPSDQQHPEDQALQDRAMQYYHSNLNQLAKSSIPKAIAATTKLQTQDINNRAATYADMQSRAQINYKETLMQRERALGVAVMQRDLYGSLFGGLAKVGGVAAALTSSSQQPASPGYYASQLNQPELGSSYDFNPTPQAPSLGMDFNFNE